MSICYAQLRMKGLLTQYTQTEKIRYAWALFVRNLFQLRTPRFPGAPPPGMVRRQPDVLRLGIVGTAPRRGVRRLALELQNTSITA